jgi:SAM-dependent MidA family methyltransferase
MPDSHVVPQLLPPSGLEEYRITAPAATPALQSILRQSIEQNGPLRFSEFMATALYQPEWGYYARAQRQVGRAGDFFTSVSVGPLFGMLLARRFLKQWRALGQPPSWRILEIGGHDGTLAADVLGAIQQLDPTAFQALEYVLCEPLPRLRAAQSQTLRHFQNANVFPTLERCIATPLPGIAFGNELLDALPFELIEWQAGRWQECRVALDASGDFVWQLAGGIEDPRLLAALAPLGKNFSEGYRTEVRTHYQEFLQPITACFSAGLMIWPDYGFTRTDYYLPERTRGTLRTFSRHHAAEDPLATPGEIDITAHVDFTAVAEAAIALGLRPRALRSQGSWLTEVGREWLLAQEGTSQPELFRQFQTLTHPSHLGRCFQVLELDWDFS